MGEPVKTITGCGIRVGREKNGRCGKVTGKKGEKQRKHGSEGSKPLDYERRVLSWTEESEKEGVSY